MKVSTILHFSICTCFSIALGSVILSKLESDQPIVKQAVESCQVNIIPIGCDNAVLQKDGNQSSELIYFPLRDKIHFCIEGEIVGYKGFDLKCRLVIHNHYINALIVFDQIDGISDNIDCRTVYNLPEIKPGFYYAVFSILNGERTIASSSCTFATDLGSYFPPLERPADFEDFWSKQDKMLKDVSPNPSLKLISSPDDPNRTYDVTMDMPYGHKVRAFLFIPKDIGNGPTVLSSIGSVDTIVRDAGKPGFHPAKDLPWCPCRLRDSVHLIIALDEASLFMNWRSSVENDLLRCIQGYVRGVDFLVSMPEVDPKNIFVSGASRGGPLAFITGARRAENVSGLSITIPTSAGISWAKKPYRGWGMMQHEGVGCPSRPDERLIVPLKEFSPNYITKFTMINRYVDPVNHAQDIIMPMVISYAIDDPLSPPQGIEAMYQYSRSAWKRISRDSGIHQVTPGFVNIQDELVTHLLNKSTGENN